MHGRMDRNAPRRAAPHRTAPHPPTPHHPSTIGEPTVQRSRPVFYSIHVYMYILFKLTYPLHPARHVKKTTKPRCTSTSTNPDAAALRELRQRALDTRVFRTPVAARFSSVSHRYPWLPDGFPFPSSRICATPWYLKVDRVRSSLHIVAAVDQVEDGRGLDVNSMPAMT
jgi:hypothetical protein